MTHPYEDLAADGDGVILGVDPPSEDELAAHADLSDEEIQARIAAHIAEQDARRAQP